MRVSCSLDVKLFDSQYNSDSQFFVGESRHDVFHVAASLEEADVSLGETELREKPAWCGHFYKVEIRSSFITPFAKLLALGTFCFG